jgi:hypothetical protein
MIYQLWDTETANMVGAFETEDAALRLVRDAARLRGRAYVDAWALECEDDQGRVEPIAEGEALLLRATGDMPARFG